MVSCGARPARTYRVGVGARLIDASGWLSRIPLWT